MNSIWRGVNPWPGLWASESELLKLARQQSYLVTVAANGQIACKACGRYLPYENPDNHFRNHMTEMDRFLLGKQEGKRESDAEGFYPAPCEACGNRIPRTGRPGRPPRLCDGCKYPLAISQAEPPLDEALIAELT